MANVRETAFDHIPPDFTLEKLQAMLSPGEIDAMRADDPDMFANEPAPPGQPAAQAPAPAQLPPPPEAPPAAVAQPLPQPPQIDIPDVSDAQAVVAAFDSKMDAVQSKYDDGEITAAEFRAQLSALAKEQAAAETKISMAAQIETHAVKAQETYQQTVAEQWKATVAQFQKANPVMFTEEHLAGFDAAARAVTGNPAFANLTMPQLIQKAAEVYRMNYTATTGKVLAGAPVPAMETPQTKLEARTDPRDPPPQTLAGLNGETMADANASVFAAIDAMDDPLEAEKAIAQMSQAQRDLYFKSV